MPQREMMNDKKWFALKDEKVHGPFAAHDLLHQISNGLWNDSRFWRKGQQGWALISKVQKDLENESQGFSPETKEETRWSIRSEAELFGPFTYDQLIEQLKLHRNHKGLFVSSTQGEQWKEVYEVESILEKLGINRRRFDRVPMSGEILFADGPLHGRTFPLSTISQKGFGCHSVTGLSIGERFRGLLRSHSLPEVIRFQAEVVFMSPSGNLGVRFQNLSTEAQTHIISYVRKFVLAHPHVDFKKTG